MAVDKTQVELMIRLGYTHCSPMFQHQVPKALNLEVYVSGNETQYWIKCEARVYRKYVDAIWALLSVEAQKEFQLHHAMSGLGYVAHTFDNLIECCNNEEDLDTVEEMRDLLHERLTPLIIKLAGGEFTGDPEFPAQEDVHGGEEPPRPIEIPEASQD
jgi:hypothetical protein